ncbi:MAG: molybdopterin molybdotransferase MoeA [Lachnospiraceae bacterium]|nr:molybdopterin molybdotransferase MoeA [Lachnospiraceae bacterium]
MLTVKTPEEAAGLLRESFPPSPLPEEVPLSEALGRVLYCPAKASEYVPGFDRSTVDGYAVRSDDTLGCSDAMPALLIRKGEVLMGEGTELSVGPGECVAVPTGGAIPSGADAMVMVEYTEDYGDGTIGILKSAAPGAGLIFRGDDVHPGKEVLPAGRKLTVQDIGALAALGFSCVTVSRKPVVGIISTGDELVPVEETPKDGQIRDVNSALLSALSEDAGAKCICYGILKDEEDQLAETVERALSECDLVLISGGSSVGMKDSTCRVLEKKGEVLFHGIAMKPGKPTILGKAGGKPVFGLPGHPVAAFFVSELFVRPLIAQMTGRKTAVREVPAVLTEAISANDGRAQYLGVILEERDGMLYASPIHSKSGLITSLAGSDGFFCIPRDCEGISAGKTVPVRLYAID